MKLQLRYFFTRSSPLKPSASRICRRRLPTLIFNTVGVSIILFIVDLLWILSSNRCCSSVSNTIVSLTSTPARFHYELPFAVHSLLSQTRLPAQIRIYLSPASAIIAQENLNLTRLRTSLQRLDSSFRLLSSFDERVRILLESQDYGPATKFIPIIKEFHGTKSRNATIMICDDDQYYHPHTLATLDAYAERQPNSIVGLRGWRSKQLACLAPPSFLLQFEKISSGVSLAKRKWRFISSSHTVYPVPIVWALSPPRLPTSSVRPSSIPTSTATSIKLPMTSGMSTTSG